MASTNPPAKLARRTWSLVDRIDRIDRLVDPDIIVPVLGVFEVTVGVLLLLGRALRLTLLLFVAHVARSRPYRAEWRAAPLPVGPRPDVSMARGPAIDLVLDRPRLSRSQFVFTEVRGRPAIFCQSSSNG